MVACNTIAILLVSYLKGILAETPVHLISAANLSEQRNQLFLTRHYWLFLELKGKTCSSLTEFIANLCRLATSGVELRS